MAETPPSYLKGVIMLSDSEYDAIMTNVAMMAEDGPLKGEELSRRANIAFVNSLNDMMTYNIDTLVAKNIPYHPETQQITARLILRLKNLKETVEQSLKYMEDEL